MAAIARTGELTPPGSTASASRYHSAERVSVSEAVTASRRRRSCVLGFPTLEIVGEVEQANLLELRRGVQRGPVRDAGLLGDGVEHRVALLLGAAVRHGEHRVRPVLVGRPLIAMRDAAEGGHAGPERGDV